MPCASLKCYNTLTKKLTFLLSPLTLQLVLPHRRFSPESWNLQNLQQAQQERLSTLFLKELPACRGVAAGCWGPAMELGWPC